MVLYYCPFCGKEVNWKISRQISFNNRMLFKCAHCDGTLSVNENEIKNNDPFSASSYLRVEKCGVRNYAQLNVDEVYSCPALQERAVLAYRTSTGSYKAPASLSPTIEPIQLMQTKKGKKNHGKAKQAPPAKAAKKNRKLLKRQYLYAILLLGSVIAGIYIYLNWFK